MNRKIFGYKFGRLRRSYGLSMHDVARLSRCSTSLVYRTEQGVRIPKPQTLVKLADGFGISKYQIFAMAGLDETYSSDCQQISEMAKRLSPADLKDLKRYTESLFEKQSRAKTVYTVHRLAPVQL